MHIAICDNDVARRKHLERLIEREANLRLKAGLVLYYDAHSFDYHSIHSLLKYNVFLINIEQQMELAPAVIKGLRNSGSTAPIYFYNCGIQGADSITCANHEIYLNDYLAEHSITAIVDLIEVALLSKKPTIEIRTEEQAHYILPSDIVMIQKDASHLKITLCNHTCLRVKEQFSYFVEVLSAYPSFFRLKKDYICNSSYVTKLHRKKVVLLQEYSAPLSFGECQRLKSFLN